MELGRFRVTSIEDLSQGLGRKTRGITAAAILQLSAAATAMLFGAAPAHAQEFSSAAAALISTIRASEDNRGLPYVIVDKLQARVFVFNARGTLVATSAALLGLARGDHSVPGIGDRPLAQIRPEERTTPAGRFFAEAGRNFTGEHVIWIDYDAALSIHRLRDSPKQRLGQRLQSPTPDDNRTSFGCVTVSVPFYENVIKPVFAGGRGFVYILPETKPWTEAFTFDIHPPAFMRVSDSALGQTRLDTKFRR